MRGDSFISTISECSAPEHDDETETEEHDLNSPARKGMSVSSECSVRAIPRWAALEEMERDRNRVSTNKERVRQITQKLSKLQQGIEADKSRARYSYENRLKQLENRFIGRETDLEEKFNEIGKQLEHLLEGLGQERLARELLDERKSKEVEVMSKQVELDLSQFKKGRDQAYSDLEKRMVQLNEEIATERYLRIQSEEKFGVKLGDQVALLVEQVKTERERNDKLSESVSRLEKQLENTRQIIEQERKSREDLEVHVVQMMEDLCSRLQHELVNEKNDREAMEETLLKLIEETCSRVVSNIE